MNNSQQYIGKIVKAKIDRPLGSFHPKHGFIYPVNYGYIPNTVSGDGEELDAYILGTNLPLSDFEGKCIAIIHRLNDKEVDDFIRNETDKTIKRSKSLE